MLRTVDRMLLALVGLVLLALGLAVLFAGFDLPRRWGVTLPADWPWSRPEDVVLSDAERTRWTDEGWWWPVALAVLAVLFLLFLWWLLAQLRWQRLGGVEIGSGDGEGAVLRGRALEDAVAAEAESQPGIDRARVVLTGKRGRPRARVGLLLTAHAKPGSAVHRLHREALAHAVTSAGLGELPAEVRMRAARHRAERVS
ncbi:alkaline shock response membrane anchor protein AmaP [Streptomyces sp. NPDC007083]|uniref:alkaline shock response membrane anchor protein AmaP n=1 Tax=Streptomyces sp. NPDC007083 TaxID=3156913 RepID=UPI0033D85FF2